MAERQAPRNPTYPLVDVAVLVAVDVRVAVAVAVLVAVDVRVTVEDPNGVAVGVRVGVRVTVGVGCWVAGAITTRVVHLRMVTVHWVSGRKGSTLGRMTGTPNPT